MPRTKPTLTALAAGIFNFNVGEINSSTTNSLPDAFVSRALQIMGDIAIPLAIVAIIYSSYTLITGAGSPDAMEKAKKNISYLVGGLALILFARILFNFVTGILK